MIMSASTIYNKLLALVHQNDFDQFCSEYQKATLPEGSDYVLLVEAMLCKHQDFALYLLHSNCKTSEPNSNNILVHIALENGWHQVVEKLLELEAPVSTQNSRGDTAVHVAFKKDYSWEVIDCLLGCYLLETKKNVKNADGLSILHVICTRPDVQCFNNIVFKSESKEQSQERAIPYEDLSCQVHLDSNSPHAGYTPLHFAVQYGCTDIIKSLIQCHVNICKQDASDSTPLHLALQRRDIEAIDIILANNAVYQDYVNKAGLTHLMAACAGSIPEIATNFMNYTNMHAWEQLKSVINAQVKDSSNPLAGYTPLHFAAEYGRFQTVQMLYFFEAYIFAKTAQDLSALVLAVKKNHMYVARLIFNYYKAYREAISNHGKDVKLPDITSIGVPSMEALVKFA